MLNRFINIKTITVGLLVAVVLILLPFISELTDSERPPSRSGPIIRPEVQGPEQIPAAEPLPQLGGVSLTEAERWKQITSSGGFQFLIDAQVIYLSIGNDDSEMLNPFEGHPQQTQLEGLVGEVLTQLEQVDAEEGLDSLIVETRLLWLGTYLFNVVGNRGFEAEDPEQWIIDLEALVIGSQTMADEIWNILVTGLIVDHHGGISPVGNPD